VATANVAEKPLCCRIDPADDPCRIEDVARDTNAVESPLEIATYCKATCHVGRHGAYRGGQHIEEPREAPTRSRPRRGAGTESCRPCGRCVIARRREGRKG
jgi:hypothetical protein